MKNPDKKRKGKPAVEPRVRLVGKPEVLRIANCSYPTLWEWMRQGDFPRSKIVGGRSMWLSTDIDRWLANLPMRPLKGDDVNNETEVLGEQGAA